MFKLWEENLAGKLENTDTQESLKKWIYLPFEICRDDNHQEYIKGELKTYGSRKSIWAGGYRLDVYDKQFVETIKRFDNRKKIINWYQEIPENILLIEYAKKFYYPFPHPMFNKSQPRTWRNTTPRTISAINLLGIAKKVDGDSITFYEGWNPQERGRMIQNKFFSK